MRTYFIQKPIRIFAAFTITVLFTLSFGLMAYADETPDYGEVTQVIEDTGQTGPAFDADLSRKAAQTSDSGVSGPAGSGPDSTKPMVALTFDDGPHTENTARLLSVLEMYGAKATFFVVGNRVSGREAILQRAIADGCEIGNHSYGHENLHTTNHDRTVQTLTATNDLVQAACGVRPTLVRPPYGASDAVTSATIGSLGMSSIMWNVDTLDWKTKNPQATIDHVLTHVKDGDIILMHDIHSTTVDACGQIIPELLNRGYQLVTVSELAKARGGLVPGANYHSFKPQQ